MADRSCIRTEDITSLVEIIFGHPRTPRCFMGSEVAEGAVAVEDGEEGAVGGDGDGTGCVGVGRGRVPGMDGEDGDGCGSATGPAGAGVLGSGGGEDAGAADVAGHVPEGDVDAPLVEGAVGSMHVTASGPGGTSAERTWIGDRRCANG